MDLKLRMKNKAFWVALIFQQLNLNIFPENIMEITNTILYIFTILGIVVDPTTPGISDKTK